MIKLIFNQIIIILIVHFDFSDSLSKTKNFHHFNFLLKLFRKYVFTVYVTHIYVALVYMCVQ